MRTETIAAVATALSDSGISVIRISGDNSIFIADRIFHTKKRRDILKNAQSHTIHYGFIYDGDEILDEVMVSRSEEHTSELQSQR